MKNFNEENAYLNAKKRVEQLKGFYGNVAAYFSIVPAMVFVNYMTDWSFQWFWIPLLGWGVGIAIHGFMVFGKDKILGKNWEENKIKELMEKELKDNKNGKL